MIATIKGDIESLEQQCMRPVLAIFDLEENGGDTSVEKGYLRQRIASIKQLQAQLRALNDH